MYLAIWHAICHMSHAAYPIYPVRAHTLCIDSKLRDSCVNLLSRASSLTRPSSTRDSAEEYLAETTSTARRSSLNFSFRVEISYGGVCGEGWGGVRGKCMMRMAYTGHIWYHIKSLLTILELSSAVRSAATLEGGSRASFSRIFASKVAALSLVASSGCFPGENWTALLLTPASCKLCTSSSSGTSVFPGACCRMCLRRGGMYVLFAAGTYSPNATIMLASASSRVLRSCCRRCLSYMGRGVGEEVSFR